MISTNNYINMNFRLLFLSLCLHAGLSFYLNAQNDKSLLIGVWEDKLSNNEISFQFNVLNEKQFIRNEIPQSSLNDSLKITRKMIYNYNWESDRIISFGKLPEQDPMRAKYFPVSYSFLRIDKIDENELVVTLSDLNVQKAALDSIRTNNNLDAVIGERKIYYRKIDFEAEKNKILLMGLWEDELSNDSTSYQFYVQKSKFGMLKVKKEDLDKETQLKPNSAYNYTWIDANTFYFQKEEGTGYAKKNTDKNKYALIRIKELDQKKLMLEFSNRPFDKLSLDYVIQEGKLEQYFLGDIVEYKRIKPVKAKS